MDFAKQVTFSIFMEKKYFVNKNILITGISGFVGTHLAQKLTSLGALVYGVSRSAEGKHILKADITDFATLNDIIEKKKIAMCFHLAAESLVELGQTNPYETFRSNIIGSLNILESARKNNLEKVILASTSHIYGDNKVPFRETYQPKPSRPYETSKTCVDILAQSYADTFAVPVVIARCINIYGPGDVNFTRLIPKTMKNIFAGEAPTMWGGGATRDYLYIDDAVNAYVHLATCPMEKVGKNKIFNFGSGNVISVKDLMQKIITLSGKDLKIKKIEDGRLDEIKTQYVSWSKAKRMLQWQPKVGLDEGLEKTLAWYSTYFAKN